MVVHLDSIRISRVRTYSGTLYRNIYISNTGLSPSMVTLSKAFFYICVSDVEVLQPHTEVWFGLFPLRSSLLRESLLISCFRLLRYFSSPTFRHQLNSKALGLAASRKRDGFPHSEIFGSSFVWELPEAYRTLQRPSSEASVKVSVIHSYVTFLFFILTCSRNK